MKKLFLSFLSLAFVASMLISPAHAEENDATTIRITDSDFQDVDYLNGATATANESIAPRAAGDLLYENYYIKVPARKSVVITSVISEWAGDRFEMQWDGATSYDPQMDIVIENMQNGKQASFYNSTGWLMHSNKGSVILIMDNVNTGVYRIWYRSLNYSDVTYYRVSVLDALG